MRYQLDTCVWEITLACCFSCKYCGSSGGTKRENELTTDECLKVCDELADLGLRRISLIGGEVFMRKDWDVIAKRLTDNGIKVAIITNGFLFDESLISRLKNANIESVAVSIDATEEIHDKYRQKGSFSRAIKAVETLTKNDIPVSVISTLNKENAVLLDDLYDILKDYPIFAWQLQACSPMGNAAKEGIDIRFDVKKVIEFVEKHLNDEGMLIGIADNIGYYSPNEGYLRGNRRGNGFFSGCKAGLKGIGIDSVGNVKGCESLYDPKFIEGNLREESLRTIWEDPERFSYNRKFTPDLLTGKCSTCEMGRFCAGGCRSYAYFVHNKMYEAPYCVRNISEE